MIITANLLLLLLLLMQLTRRCLILMLLHVMLTQLLLLLLLLLMMMMIITMTLRKVLLRLKLLLILLDRICLLLKLLRVTLTRLLHTNTINEMRLYYTMNTKNFQSDAAARMRVSATESLHDIVVTISSNASLRQSEMLTLSRSHTNASVVNVCITR